MTCLIGESRRETLPVVVLAGLIVGLILAGCSARTGGASTPPVEVTQGPTEPSATATPVPRQELVLCVGHAPDLRPGSGDPAAEAILRLVSPQAAVFGSDYVAGTDLLTSLPNTEDGTLRRNEDGTLTVTLRYRDGLVWSDGTPFDAHEALQGLALPGSPYAPAFEVISAQQQEALVLGVTAAGDAEYPYVPSQPPLPVHVLGDLLDQVELSESSLLDLLTPSLGPYVFTEAAENGSLRFEANPYYAKGESLIPRVTIRVVDDPAQVWTELTNGGCDVALDVRSAPDQQTDGEGSSALSIYTLAGPLYDQVIFNTYTGDTGRAPVFADVRVRQAVAYAFDRGTLAQALWGGMTPVMDSWLPADHWAHPSPDDLIEYSLDLEAAGRLLDEAGWRDEDGDGTREYHGEGGEYSCQRGGWSIDEGVPLLVTLIVPDGDTLRAHIADRLVQDLRQIGITVNVQRIPPETLFSREGPLVQREFDLALLAAFVRPDPGGVSQWVGAEVFRHPQTLALVHRWELEDRFLKPEQMVERLAYNNMPSLANDYQGQNFAGWCNEVADILVVSAAADALDLSQRQPVYAQHQTLFAAEVPVLPLLQRPLMAASAPYVCGLEPGPYDPLTWNVAAWWFDESGKCQP